MLEMQEISGSDKGTGVAWLGTPPEKTQDGLDG